MLRFVYLIILGINVQKNKNNMITNRIVTRFCTKLLKKIMPILINNKICMLRKDLGRLMDTGDFITCWLTLIGLGILPGRNLCWRASTGSGKAGRIGLTSFKGLGKASDRKIGACT